MDGRLLGPALAARSGRARGGLARLLAAGLAAGACLLGPAVARADDGLSIVAPSPGYAGATVDLVGCGFQAGEAVHLALDGG